MEIANLSTLDKPQGTNSVKRAGNVSESSNDGYPRPIVENSVPERVVDDAINQEKNKLNHLNEAHIETPDDSTEMPRIDEEPHKTTGTVLADQGINIQTSKQQKTSDSLQLLDPKEDLKKHLRPPFMHANASTTTFLKQSYNFLKNCVNIKDRLLQDPGVKKFVAISNVFLAVSFLVIIIFCMYVLWAKSKSFGFSKWKWIFIQSSTFIVVFFLVLVSLGMYLGPLAGLSKEGLTNKVLRKCHDFFKKRYFKNKDGPVVNPGLGKRYIFISGVCRVGSLLGLVFIFVYAQYGLWEINWLLIDGFFLSVAAMYALANYLNWLGARLHIPLEKFTNIIVTDRKLILYLRSFMEDSSFLAWNDAEYSIMLNFSKNVEVVGIGMPEEKIQNYGIKKIYFSRHTEEWKNAVNELMAKASLIVVSFNSSVGLLWEINQIISGKALAKTLFYFPVVADRDNMELYNRFSNLFQQGNKVNMPSIAKEHFNKPQIIAFSDENSPKILKSHSRRFEILRLISFGYPIPNVIIVNAKLDDYINELNSRPQMIITQHYYYQAIHKLFALGYILYFVLIALRGKRIYSLEIIGVLLVISYYTYVTLTARKETKK